MTKLLYIKVQETKYVQIQKYRTNLLQTKFHDGLIVVFINFQMTKNDLRKKKKKKLTI